MALVERGGSNQRIGAWVGEIPIESHYTAGIGGERFFRAMKEEGKLVGAWCPGCRETLVPPRLFCERCFEKLGELRPLALPGWIASATRIHIDLDGKRLERPQWMVLVEFDDARGGIVHRLEVSEGETPQIGDPVEPVFVPQERRQGGILDIEHFRISMPR